jgi:hypothetical protein
MQALPAGPTRRRFDLHQRQETGSISTRRLKCRTKHPRGSWRAENWSSADWICSAPKRSVLCSTVALTALASDKTESYGLHCPSGKDSATDTLERRLWDAADQIRANTSLTAAQYSQPAPNPEPPPDARPAAPASAVGGSPKQLKGSMTLRLQRKPTCRAALQHVGKG